MFRLMAMAALGVGVLFLFMSYTPTIEHAPGTLVPEAPRQDPDGKGKSWRHEGYRLRSLARFELEARVLSTQRYRRDRESEIAPWDLALGWQEMSDQAVIDRVNIRQSGRFYRWWYRGELPVDPDRIPLTSANMHIVPANDAVAETLAEIEHGDIIRLAGHLIEARGADGLRWRSSTTRRDTGPSSCELIRVHSLKIVTDELGKPVGTG